MPFCVVDLAMLGVSSALLSAVSLHFLISVTLSTVALEAVDSMHQESAAGCCPRVWWYSISYPTNTSR